MTKKTTNFKKGKASKAEKENGIAIVTIPTPKPKTLKPKVATEQRRFYCNEIGHWKRNNQKYLEEKKKGTSTLGIYVIEVNMTTFSSIGDRLWYSNY